MEDLQKTLRAFEDSRLKKKYRIGFRVDDDKVGWE